MQQIRTSGREQVQAEPSPEHGSSTTQKYVALPRLSDRCGGSCDDALLVPVPAGTVLPDSVALVDEQGR